MPPKVINFASAKAQKASLPRQATVNPYGTQPSQYSQSYGYQPGYAQQSQQPYAQVQSAPNDPRYDLLQHQWHSLYDYCAKLADDEQGSALMKQWGAFASAYTSGATLPTSWEDQTAILEQARARAREIGCGDARAFADISKTYKPEGYFKDGKTGVASLSALDSAVTFIKEHPIKTGLITLGALLVGAKLLR